MESFICLFALLCMFTDYSKAAGTGGSHWNYAKHGRTGPGNWHLNYSDCGGVMQSPIDVVTSKVLYDPEKQFFNFTDYGNTDGVTMNLYNMGGHTVEVILGGTPIYIRGGSLPHEYQVDQFHFHWGLEDTRGSEHAIDGHHFPMEMHIVHHLTSMADSKKAAVHPFGLAVIGFFFQIGNANPTIQKLIKHFDAISKPGEHTAMPTFVLTEILPAGYDKLNYYRYMGSLTTPPCYETVLWSLSQTHLEISEDQLNAFRNLFEDKNGTVHLADDFRPVQKLNHRTVTSNEPSGFNC